MQMRGPGASSTVWPRLNLKVPSALVTPAVRLGQSLFVVASALALFSRMAASRTSFFGKSSIVLFIVFVRHPLLAVRQHDGFRERLRWFLLVTFTDGKKCVSVVLKPFVHALGPVVKVAPPVGSMSWSKRTLPRKDFRKSSLVA